MAWKVAGPAVSATDAETVFGSGFGPSVRILSALPLALVVVCATECPAACSHSKHHWNPR